VNTNSYVIKRGFELVAWSHDSRGYPSSSTRDLWNFALRLLVYVVQLRRPILKEHGRAIRIPSLVRALHECVHRRLDGAMDGGQTKHLSSLILQITAIHVVVIGGHQDAIRGEQPAYL
jgi:hypothetical protein